MIVVIGNERYRITERGMEIFSSATIAGNHLTMTNDPKNHLSMSNDPKNQFPHLSMSNDPKNQFASASAFALSVTPNGQVGIGSISTGAGTSTSTGYHQYSAPELMDIIVTDKTIEHVYKRYSLIWSGYGNQQPEIYKEVYSRFDGSMKIVQGNYSSPQPEGYYFNDEENDVNATEQV